MGSVWQPAFDSNRLERARREESEPAAVPLVSVRIATYNRPDLLVDRAVRSALNQTYPRIEVVVVGDNAVAGTAERLAALRDPRLRYYNIPLRPWYPPDQPNFWRVAGARAMNVAVALCRGDWIAPLDDDDEFLPEHIETLVKACQAHCWDFAYSSVSAKRPGEGFWNTGSAPLGKGRVAHLSVLYSRRLQFMWYDVDAWRLFESADGNMWRRMREAGARMGFVDRVLGRHYYGGH